MKSSSNRQRVVGIVDWKGLVCEVHMPDFPTLDIVIPDWAEPSHPFSRGENPEFYTPESLGDKATGKTHRTHFFEKIFTGLFWKLEAPVPYAFKTADGETRSLDAGCIKFLANRGDDEIVFHLGPDRTIMAASPGQKLLQRFKPMRPRLIAEVTPTTRGIFEAAFQVTSIPVGVIGLTPYSLTSELEFSLTDPLDERRKMVSLRIIREGQKDFRKAVLSAWQKRCPVTVSRTLPVLEAAHLFRYLGPKTNDVRNGVALRADIHVLFDKNLIGFKPQGDTLRIAISKRLLKSEYSGYDGQNLKLPTDKSLCPDPNILEFRYLEFKKKEEERSTEQQ